MEQTPGLSREEEESIDRVTHQARAVRERFTREMDDLIRDLGRLKTRRPGLPPPPPPPTSPPIDQMEARA